MSEEFHVMSESEFLNQQLTPHFKRSEFACKCRKNGKAYCSPIHANPDPRLAEMCEIIRQYIDKPITINSGCRCEQWNKISKGVSNSEHIVGLAADLSCAIGGKALFVAIQDLYKAGKLPNLRYALYYTKRDFVHIDMSVNKKRAQVFTTTNS